MNIYEFALDFENEHRDFYADQAEKIDNPRLKKVFKELQHEEEKHAEIVKQLEQKKRVSEVESSILPQVKEAFEEISGDLPNNPLPDDQADLYLQAQEMEKRSHEFYTSKAEETDLPQVKETFNKLAEEEKKHENIMRNLHEFVNRPETWLDDAEWYHLEDY